MKSQIIYTAPPTTAAIAASTLLEDVLVALQNTAPFLVLRNHENLPYSWGNDVDILVSAENLERTYEVICRTMRKQSGFAPVEVMKRINFRAVRLACADRELHIDLYSSMSKAWVIYAETEAILAARRSTHSLFDVPAPLHELLLIAAKELFSYGEVRTRYHSRFFGQDHEAALAAANEIFGNFLTESGQALVAETLADPFTKGRPAPRISAVMRPLQAVLWAQMRREDWSAL